jgi:hypothetical protein
MGPDRIKNLEERETFRISEEYMADAQHCRMKQRRLLMTQCD